jgi:hypothetical protein
VSRRVIRSVFYQEAETRIASASLGEAFNRPFACYPSTLLRGQRRFPPVLA